MCHSPRGANEEAALLASEPWAKGVGHLAARLYQRLVFPSRSPWSRAPDRAGTSALALHTSPPAPRYLGGFVGLPVSERPFSRDYDAGFPELGTLSREHHGPHCYSSITESTMKSKKKTDHLERTANNFRQEVISPAKVCGITNESETVKRLRLAVSNKDFTFKAGQWVDFFIPDVAVVGGFSICSSPGLLEEEGVLELAVKHTVHPPAHWIHTQCTLDSEVALRVGGNFFFDPQPADSSVNLVLIAGGVGINPLFSILLHVADFLRNQESEGNGYKMETVKLYYSAKNTNELLFKNSLGQVASCNLHRKKELHLCKQNIFHVTQKCITLCDPDSAFDDAGVMSNSVENNCSFNHQAT
ncbi:oxidoreductase NAD-binding domain-containing protein 1 isoform X2 [Pelodiscus sinensis]|uniref:oxidoreductase NAD-binding domain-containing protein 1 isoform X2 n=1 Tax=Pelodiscus sinensis TaxID=13735 RepID=UPI003F6D0C5F